VFNRSRISRNTPWPSWLHASCSSAENAYLSCPRSSAGFKSLAGCERVRPHLFLAYLRRAARLAPRF